MDVRLHTIFAEAATDKIMNKHLQQELKFSQELARTWTKHFNGNLAGLRDMLTSAGHAAAVHGFLLVCANSCTFVCCCSVLFCVCVYVCECVRVS